MYILNITNNLGELHNHPFIYSLMFVFFVVLFIYLRRQNRLKEEFKDLSESYDSLFNNMKEGVALHRIVVDDDNHPVDYIFLKVNRAFEEITTFKSKDIINQRVKTVMPMTEKYWIEKYGEVALTGKPYTFENYSQQMDKYFKVNVYSPHKGEFITVFSDITDEIKIKKGIEKERALFKTTLYSLSDAVISSDLNGKIELMNKVAEELTGWKAKEAIGKNFCDVYNYKESDQCLVRKVLNSKKPVPVESDKILLRKDETELYIEHSAAPITDNVGNILGAVVVSRDYSTYKYNLEKITYLSYHDQLTGLYNRRFYNEEAERLDVKRNLPISLIMIDVNGLKLTNDAFGHNKGDELLITVAEIIRNVCRKDEIISRIGGDEIVILLPSTTYEETSQVVERIYEEINKVRLGNIVISVSIGFATKDDESMSISDIFVLAEEHMYRKKITETNSMRNQTIQVILKTLNESNEREKIHSERVSVFAAGIAKLMGFNEHEVNEIKTAALMHDIGKITIANNLLNKEGGLTESEYTEVKKHTESGYHILKSVDQYSELADFVLSHHERWDGDGYPQGLKGEEIPVFSRIIAIADTFEAMTADRPYRNAVNKEDALKEIIECAGTQFDPDIVEICKNAIWTRE